MNITELKNTITEMKKFNGGAQQNEYGRGENQ